MSSPPTAVALRGSCHCGNLEITFGATRLADELPTRRCVCSFCARQGAYYTSDPAGAVEIRVGDARLLGRYRFRHLLGDFLFCRRCGCYAGAFEPGDPGRAVLNVRLLDDADRFPAPRPVEFGAEESEARRARWRRTWTPARLHLQDA